MLNILFNWIRQCWQIRDSDDDKWYSIVKFDGRGMYIKDNAHIHQLLSPLD